MASRISILLASGSSPGHRNVSSNRVDRMKGGVRVGAALAAQRLDLPAARDHLVLQSLVVLMNASASVLDRRRAGADKGHWLNGASPSLEREDQPAEGNRADASSGAMKSWNGLMVISVGVRPSGSF